MARAALPQIRAVLPVPTAHGACPAAPTHSLVFPFSSNNLETGGVVLQVEAMSLKVLSRCKRKWGKVLKPPPRRMSEHRGVGGGLPCWGQPGGPKAYGQGSKVCRGCGLMNWSGT